MWLYRSLFLKTVRDQRGASLAWGTVLGLVVLVGATQYGQLLGGSGAARAQQIADLTKLFQSYSALLGELVSLDTLGGFLTVRVLGFLPVVLALWAAVAGVSLIRGEEEPGVLDMVVATPHGRAAIFGQKAGALGVAIVVTVGLFGAGLVAGGIAAGAPFAPGALLAVLINSAALAAFWAAAGLLAGQLTRSRRTAAAVTGGLALAAWLVTNVVENLAGWRGLAWLLPFHWYAISKPLVPGRGLDLTGWLLLVAGTILLLGLSLALFTRRDIGAAFALLPRRRGGRPVPPRLAWLGSILGKSTRDLVGTTLAGGVSLALLAALIVGTTNAALAPLRAALRAVPLYAQLLGDLTNNESFLSASLFSFLPLMLVLFAILQVAAWAGDEQDGRLEVLVAQPAARPRLLLARYAAAVLSLAGMLALAAAGTLGTAVLAGVRLDAGRVLAGLVGVAPVVLVFLAGGLCLATWLPRPGRAVPILTAVVVVMFFLDLLASLFDWPPWVRSLSVFYLYGRPLVNGMPWGHMAGLTGLTLLLAAASVAGFSRRDLAK